MVRVVSSSLVCLSMIVGAASAADPATRRSGVSIESAWARATPPGIQVGAAYAIIKNEGDADRLLAIETTASGRVEMHNTTHADGRMRMRQVTVLDVPARGRVTFEPSGMHLMLVELKQPLRAGESLPLTFVFAKAGRVAARATIAPIGSTQAPTQEGLHHGHH